MVDASTLQLQRLKDTCDGRQECHIKVQRQRCGLYDTDYESVTYMCKTLGKLPVRHATGKGMYFENYIKLMVRTNVMSVKGVPTYNKCHAILKDLFCLNLYIYFNTSDEWARTKNSYYPVFISFGQLKQNWNRSIHFQFNS